MTHHRTVQLVAAIAAVASLVAASALSGPIVRQRRAMIEQNKDNRALAADDRLPPSVALAMAAAGPLRAMIVNILWYRAQEMQNERLFYEANDLASWITRLQPRYAKVWDFHAWNMAYNISVMVYTPQERWDWINKGIHMLRQEAIPLNPAAVYLYKQLSWIFFHKVGGRMDDMHWHYKREFISDWHELLGAPEIGQTHTQAIADFRAIAQAPRRLSDLLAAHPKAEELFDALHALGLRSEEPMLRAVVQAQTFHGSVLEDMFGKDSPRIRETYDPAVAALINDPRHAEAMPHVLAYLRRAVLEGTYRLETAFMLKLMEEHGPIDWRNPYAHGIYYSQKGVEIAGGLQTERNLDLLNVLRNTLHNLQDLSWQGRVVFNPVEHRLNPRYIPTLHPEPRIIPAYIRKMEETLAILDAAPEKYTESARDGIRRGFENYLHAAVRDTYLYGTVEEAQRHYNFLREKFSDFTSEGENRFLYQKPLEEFVTTLVRREWGNPLNARIFIEGFLLRGLTAGLAEGRADVWEHHLDLGKQMYDEYTKKRADTTVNAPLDRLRLQPYEQIIEDTVARYVLDQRQTPTRRATVYRGLNPQFQLGVYDLVAPELRKQFARFNGNFDRSFPPPKGLDEYRKANAKKIQDARLRMEQEEREAAAVRGEPAPAAPAPAPR